MIIGIGIDIVEISRFKSWHLRTKKQLRRVFSEYEISYCLKNKVKCSERFAARFAAKEAFFKAVSPYLNHKMSFLSLCPYIEIYTNPLKLQVLWRKISLTLDPKDIKIHTSLTHSTTSASAVVILELLQITDFGLKSSHFLLTNTSNKLFFK